jgi:YesN/AraC family two-component response regulator
VTNGAEGLRNIQRTSFALAFIDIWMPELTGLAQNPQESE